MKRKIYYRLASFMLAVLCVFVSLPTGGLAGILTIIGQLFVTKIKQKE